MKKASYFYVSERQHVEILYEKRFGNTLKIQGVLAKGKSKLFSFRDPPSDSQFLILIYGRVNSEI